MAILAGHDTRIVVQGMTGRAGTFYADAAIRYGSSYVGGVRPGKGGRRHLGLPLFDSVDEARAATGANASLIVVPAYRAAEAMIEAIEGEIELVVCITERVPVHDMVRVKDALDGSGTVLVGPNSQGVLVPNIAKIGVMSTSDTMPGCIGIVSRSASLTSEIVALTTRVGYGQSTTVGIGGDPIHGLGFRRCLELFKDDSSTRAVVLIGEVGGTEEEEAARYLEETDFGKPVVSLVVGKHAPQDRRMGHAGSISVIGSSSAGEKAARLASSGSTVVTNPDEISIALEELLG